MAEHRDEVSIRKQKIKELEDSGVNPYPAVSNRTHTVSEFVDSFSEDGKEYTLAGRVRLKREHGKLSFLRIQDGTDAVQLVLRGEDMQEGQYAEALHFIDVGDIVECVGTPFVTQKGEHSLLVSEWRMLSKAVQPLPDKWKGLQDEEARYRKRYVDMLMDDDLREMFQKKAIFWNSMRTFLLKEGFMEVETPVLENTTGGADAEPFVTHHNALDIDVYLRISMGELWQKRLMVAGFDKTFEIGRQFRNEGMSPEHLQDYTQMEFYYGYADYNVTMELVERMYKHVIHETFGAPKFKIRGFDIDFSGEWERLDYRQAVLDGLGIDILEATDQELRAKIDDLGISLEEKAGRGRMMDYLWKQVRKEVAGPVFLINHPVEVSPLAKRKEDDPRLVERYQVIIAGSELGNGYSELNDPIDQASRFEEQARLRAAGDTEAQMHDQEFVEALEHGMPPTSGFGLSERLFSFLMDVPIKEAVLFPLLRPRDGSGGEPNDSKVTSASEVKSIGDDGPDASLEDFDPQITRDDAENLVFEHVKAEGLRKHMLATESIMRAAALHFKAKNVDAWGIAGLLHDVDYEQVEVEQHSLVGAEMLQKEGVHTLIVDAVREHNPAHGLPPQTMLSKALMTLETISGLIIAGSMVRPDKSVAEMQLKSVKKKFKDKSFAAGVDRSVIAQVEPLLGITVEEALGLSLEAMRTDREKLGL